MRYKLILYIIVFCLIIASINAQTSSKVYDFDATIEPIKSSIYLNETAEFLITIFNNNYFSNRYRFDEFDFTQWSTDTKPNILGGVEIPAKSEKTVRLFLFPVNVIPGIYALDLVVRSDDTKTVLKKQFQINVKSKMIPQQKYEPDIRGDFRVSEENKIDPRKKETMLISLKNKNLLYISGLQLKVESEKGLFSFEKEGIDFIPLEQKDLTFSVELDPKTLPQQDKLLISWKAGNATFGPYGHLYDIIGYELPFEVTKEKQKKFLRMDNVVSVKNPGTLEKEEKIKVETGWFARLFTSPEPEAIVIKEDGKKYFAFNIRLAPGGATAVKTIVSYRLITSVIILIIIGIILYYKYRSPVIVKKKESVVKMKEGGISELKILLYVKNRSKYSIEDIEIKESIPHIAEIDKEIEIGTIKPSSITKHKIKGTIVRWGISSLEQFEERIITYNIKSRLSILGSLTLPATRAKFKARGKDRVTTSNKLRLTRS